MPIGITFHILNKFSFPNASKVKELKYIYKALYFLILVFVNSIWMIYTSLGTKIPNVGNEILTISSI